MILCVALLIAVVSPGQPISHTYASIEALTVPADCVFTGRIESIESIVTVPKNGKRGISRYPSGLTMHTLTIKVDEILKGEPGKSVVLQEEAFGSDEQWPKWAEEHALIIWFTGPGEFDAWSALGHMMIPFDPEKADVRWIAVRIRELAPGESPDRNGWTLPMFAMDMSVLRTPAEVLSRARAYIKSAPKSPTLHEIDLPWALVKEAGYSIGGPSFLVVPKSIPGRPPAHP